MHRPTRRGIFSKLRKSIFPASLAGFFVASTTEADSNFNSGADYNIGWRLSDVLSHLGLSGVTIPWLNGQSYTSKSGAFSPSLQGALNKFSVGGALGYLALKFLPVPYKSYLSPVAKGAMIGGAIGGIFDPAVPSVPRPSGVARSTNMVSNPVQWGQT